MDDDRHVLDYHTPQKAELDGTATTVGAWLLIPLLLAHAWYGAQGAFLLIGSGTRCLILPVHLPSGFVLWLGDVLAGDIRGGVFLGAFAVWMASTVFAAATTAWALSRLAAPKPHNWGRWHWRWWAAVLSWVWIPVPAQLHWVYYLGY
jgi:hypothetical protein